MRLATNPGYKQRNTVLRFHHGGEITKFENHILRTHPTVTVEVGPWREEIDEALAPLIGEIWKAGIETMMSCQETEPGISWIEFDSAEETLRFLNLIARYEPGVDTLYNRIHDQRTGPMSAPVWEYQFNLMDVFDGVEGPVTDGMSDFDATVGVYFPTTDIPVLLQRLEAFNNAR